jgi:hypothetical protein
MTDLDILIISQMDFSCVPVMIADYKNNIVDSIE